MELVGASMTRQWSGCTIYRQVTFAFRHTKWPGYTAEGNWLADKACLFSFGAQSSQLCAIAAIVPSSFSTSSSTNTSTNTQALLLFYIKNEKDSTMTKEEDIRHSTEHQEALVFQNLVLTAKWAARMRKEWMMRWHIAHRGHWMEKSTGNFCFQCHFTELCIVGIFLLFCCPHPLPGLSKITLMVLSSQLT